MYIIGQERAAQFTRVCYRGAAGCIITFDLTDRQSFEDVQKWKLDFDSKVRNRGKGGLRVPSRKGGRLIILHAEWELVSRSQPLPF